MKISIFASIGAQNLGDELILKNEVELLRREFGDDTTFKIASYEPKNSLFHIQKVEYFEYFPLGIKQFKNILKNIRNFFKFLGVIIWSNVVVIGGGGIIYDNELQSVGNPLKQWLFRVQVARFFRKKVYFYALGIDIKDPDNDKILEKIFKKSWKITVRDMKSWEQLKSIGIDSEVVDDPVMSEAGGNGKILGAHSSRTFKLKDFDVYELKGKRVGLALRSGYIGSSGDPRVERLLVEELCGYIEKKGGKIIFIPHSLHKSDMKANDYEFMKQFINYERDIYANLGEVYTAYNHQMVDIVVCMRLHSIILSYVYGIDQIALSYSSKTDELIKKLTS